MLSIHLYIKRCWCFELHASLSSGYLSTDDDDDEFQTLNISSAFTWILMDTCEMYVDL